MYWKTFRYDIAVLIVSWMALLIMLSACPLIVSLSWWFQFFIGAFASYLWLKFMMRSDAATKKYLVKE